MLENLLQMDVLGLGAMVACLLFLALILKFLLDDRSFDGLEERKSAATRAATAGPESDDRTPTPRGSSSTRRAA